MEKEGETVETETERRTGIRVGGRETGGVEGEGREREKETDSMTDRN